MNKASLLLLATFLCLVTAEYPKTNSKCNLDTECASFEHCNTAGRCQHNNLFPLRSIEIAGFMVYTIIVFFSNFSGIAGGLTLVAIISMLNFNMKFGIMLSNAQIMSAGIVRLAMDAQKSHPLRPHGILLDYPIVTMMLPMITLGSALATVVTRLMPDIIITIAYAIIMAGILVFNVLRLVALVRKEQKAATYKPPVAQENPTEPSDSEQNPQSARESPPENVGDDVKIKEEVKVISSEKL
jgi:hypothetical protein